MIKNEFTIKVNGRGTRGSSVGKYLSTYVSRDGASEKLLSRYTTEYMARKGAVDNDMYDGVGFSLEEVSLSRNKFLNLSKKMQRLYEKGRTVLKTVISFDNEYLKENNIIPNDIEVKRRGQLGGKYDQAKLRLAIMKGISKIKGDYDHLEALGVIQHDTKHLHCHLVLADSGPNPNFKGKINAIQKEKIRRGVDNELDKSQKIRSYAKDLELLRSELYLNVKNQVYNHLISHGLLQVLMVKLPDNMQLWRAKTNNKQMQQANAFAREYVDLVFRNSYTIYQNAMTKILDYADARGEKENLSKEERDKLIKNGEDGLYESGINALYQSLKQIKKEERNINTPYFDRFDKNNQKNSPFDTLIEKMSLYQKRLADSKKERKKARSFLNQFLHNDYSKDSLDLYEFMKFEEKYQEGVYDKYQNLLRFYPTKRYYQYELDNYNKCKDKYLKIGLLLQDKKIENLSTREAEKYCKEMYDIRGGSNFNRDRSIFVVQQELFRRRMVESKEKLDDRLNDYNLVYHEEDGSIKKKGFNFHRVKHLDIHNEPIDIEIAPRLKKKFIDLAQKRIKLYNKARDYLEQTDQDIDVLPNHDIFLMRERLRLLEEDKKIEKVAKNKTKKKKNKVNTVRLDLPILDNVYKNVEKILVENNALNSNKNDGDIDF